MRFVQITKRVFLFALVNILILLTVNFVLHLLRIDRMFGRQSDYTRLLIFCFIWGMGGAFVSLAISRWMAKFSMGVQVIDPDTSDPDLRNLVETVHGLARRAGLAEMPEVGIYPSPEINAFATGPSQSSALVAVSSGLLDSMRRSEVEGVLGHEIAHIANGDMVTMTLVQGVVNAFVIFFAQIAAFAVAQAMRSRDDERGGFGGNWMEFMLVNLFQVVFGLLGMIPVNAFSRWREFRADAGGAKYAGSNNMIGALRALKQLHDNPQEATFASNSSSSAAFDTLKIDGGRTGLFNLLLASHPPIEERIARLEQMRA
jgi:heat shock protein HtpX